MLPKVEAPSQLETVDWLLGQLERERGLEQGALDLLPIVETGRGVAAAEAIAGAARGCGGSPSAPATIPAT